MVALWVLGVARLVCSLVVSGSEYLVSDNTLASFIYHRPRYVYLLVIDGAPTLRRRNHKASRTVAVVATVVRVPWEEMTVW